MAVTRHKKKRGWFRFLIYLVFLISVPLIAGFLAFVRHVYMLTPPENMPVADGIVVWTGKGGDRLTTAGRLLEQGHGERLLISGVNEALSEQEVIDLLNVGTEKGTCCVDLDYEAQDTIGNAFQTQHWVKSLDYEHIILVTSAYHMPRASLEIRNQAGRVRITPYPVQDKTSEKWWEDKTQRERLMREYGKLLLTWLRNSGGKNEREPAELPDLPEKTEN